MLQGVVELPLINFPQFSLMSPEQLWGLSRLFPEIKHSRAMIHVNCLCSKAIHFWCGVVLLSICVLLHPLSSLQLRDTILQTPLWQQIVITAEDGGLKSVFDLG